MSKDNEFKKQKPLESVDRKEFFDFIKACPKLSHFINAMGNPRFISYRDSKGNVIAIRQVFYSDINNINNFETGEGELHFNRLDEDGEVELKYWIKIIE